MTPPVTTEALVEALAQTMWEQSYGTLANASWAEAHRIAKAIPDGQAAWNIETVRRKASEIVNLHVAPLLAAHQQVTAERDRYRETHRWNIDRTGDGEVLVCRGHHDKGEDCDHERFVPEERLATATSELARLRAEGEDLRAALKVFAAMSAMDPPESVPLNEWLPAITGARAVLNDRTALARAATAREG